MVDRSAGVTRPWVVLRHVFECQAVQCSLRARRALQSVELCLDTMVSHLRHILPQSERHLPVCGNWLPHRQDGTAWLSKTVGTYSLGNLLVVLQCSDSVVEDTLWHRYTGAPQQCLVLDARSCRTTLRLGQSIQNGADDPCAVVVAARRREFASSTRQGQSDMAIDTGFDIMTVFARSLCWLSCRWPCRIASSRDHL
jgi:hypothetical protein